MTGSRMGRPLRLSTASHITSQKFSAVIPLVSWASVYATMSLWNSPMISPITLNLTSGSNFPGRTSQSISSPARKDALAAASFCTFVEKHQSQKGQGGS